LTGSNLLFSLTKNKKAASNIVFLISELYEQERRSWQTINPLLKEPDKAR
jgi:hypothetical protein